MTQKIVTGIVKIDRLTEIQEELKAIQTRLEFLTHLYDAYLKTFAHVHRTEVGNLYENLTLSECKILNRTSDKLSAVKKVIKDLYEETRNIAKEMISK